MLMPLPECPPSVPKPPETITLLEHLAKVPLTSTQIRSMTDHDPTLAKVKHLTQNGWPTTVADKQLRTYWYNRDEISIEDGILLWGSRVIVLTQAY